MNPARLDLDGLETDEPVKSPAPVRVVEGAEQAADRLESPSDRQGLRCPRCASLIYSRRHRLCGVGSAPLPSELLFSPTEAERIEGVLRVERRRHKDWLQRFA